MCLKKLRNYIGEFKAYNKERKQVVFSAKIGKKDRLCARIIRYVHSIEKGLSISAPRAEFGYDKIKQIYAWINEYLSLGEVDKMCVYMAADAISSYCKYHQSINFSSEKITEIKTIADKLTQIKEKDGVEGVFGGVSVLKNSDIQFDFNTIEKLFKTRHSIRQFSGQKVESELIKKAIELAQCAPSACNRQAVRAYSIDTKKFIESYQENLQGVGGFAEECDKFILVTGKISAYEESEYKQFVVSAGIFAGYLSLALHALGLGACVVQRSLRPNEKWKKFCEEYSIDKDEQLICLVAVGKLNQQTVVPVSKRFDVDSILKHL